MSELIYTNESGDQVKTSQFLKNRGSCCKTSCLHCPYNFTLNKHGLEFEQLKLESMAKAQRIIDDNSPKEENSVSASLLASAFGGAKKKDTISKFQLDSYRIVKIKDHICGVVKVGKLGVSALYLKEHFKDQGLTKDTVASFFNPEL
ncbi:hypothetical protein BIY24_04175 [Halobacteriovorax marinus]|uniref:Uncharacterized protein n=1 Tax=Halobacteriovorax marinus (strain ATCC BAA-682 / DSM 15412 / SJ) TaxID=862908 RepID=E1WX77_HALMS|nr:DUF5522 domain-containing protein [Halobacteriovorax marinus]ATH07162.1 hypothetical protein BIY24_04175 [Halobacteriovorax marinus]CBW25778.1 hypothetical protein BMS_0887 [Halobacteriovorax marinus SJ]